MDHSKRQAPNGNPVTKRRAGLVLVQSLDASFLIVREVYTEGRNPPLRHQLELLIPGHDVKVLGVIPALVREICFVSSARGYVCTARDMYWTETAGRDWKKTSTRTADPFTGKVQSVSADGSISSPARKPDLSLFTGLRTQRLAYIADTKPFKLKQIAVDREKSTMLVAGKWQGKWVSVSVSNGVPGEILPIAEARPDEMSHVLHAENGEATLITISTGRFLPSYSSFLYRSGRWHREDIGDAR